MGPHGGALASDGRLGRNGLYGNESPARRQEIREMTRSAKLREGIKEQSMGMGFLSSIERVEAAENEDAAVVGGARGPVARFTEAAVDVGLIRPGDKLDRNMVELCLRVVEMAAIIGDGHLAAWCPEDTVGTHIRAELAE